jgi:Fic family protein
MKRLPQVTVPLLARELGMTAPTARSALNHMVEFGVIEEMSGKKRDKVYVYRKYLDILEEGAEPFRAESRE